MGLSNNIVYLLEDIGFGDMGSIHAHYLVSCFYQRFLTYS